MISKLILKKNDLQPYYYVQAKDYSDNPISLTGATIYCTMKSDSGTVKINKQTAGISITDAANGLFEYHWQAADTDTVGIYYIEFEIAPISGGKFTLPTQPAAVVQIIDSLDTT
jgi:hypothetical protein